MIKKTDYDTKVTEIQNNSNNHNHDKYVTTTEFNPLAADVFDSRLSIANLVAKTDLSIDSIKLLIIKQKNKSIKNEFKKIKTFDSSYFIGENYFEEDGTQNHLVFQSIRRYFKTINTKYISSWKSKGLSEKTITPYATSDNSLTPLIDYYGIKVSAKFNRSCLKQPNKLINIYNVNIYNVYEIGASGSNNSDPTLKKCLLGAVTLTKKCRY